ncbi:MAG: hypothetical protein U9Q98_11605 [Bacteroidota bacterium]|nr:hypothetical protein [Bacteroidota bacterium]
MKYTFFSIAGFFLLLCFSLSCTDDNIDSGIKGYIEFGEVNCHIAREFWTFQPYNGMVYAVPYDSVSGYGSYTSISDSVQANDGEFTLGLSPGHYYIFIEPYQIFNEQNHIVVYLNQISEPDLQFYKCI